MKIENKLTTNWRDILITSIAIFSLLFIFLLKPIPQDLSYHNFADMRTIFGISNFFDVISNLPFFIVGFVGCCTVIKYWGLPQSWSWLVLFLAVLSVSLGSAYYHLIPENNTLTWDRLPMAIGFMALLVIVLTDYINENLEKWLLLPMCSLGVFSVAYWHLTDDLRIYAWVQFASMTLILITILVYKQTYLSTKYLLFSFLFYILSKFAEHFDKFIYEVTSEILSGHTIKHLLASIATLFFYLLVRHVITQIVD